MKKTLLLGCMFLLMFAMSGCAKVIELTDEENYLIAEYAAELLLKYDRNTDLKYTGAEDEPTTEEITTEEATTAENTGDTATEAPATEETPDSAQDTTESLPENDPNYAGITNVSDVEADAEGRDFDIAAYVEAPNVSIKYTYYMLADRYPSYDHEGVFIEIEAPTGYKLLIVKFDIENLTNEPQTIDLYSKDISYNIILNDSKSAKQMLTILIDDLYTYQSGIDASMREEAVLLFQVSDTMASRIQDVKLKVTYNGESKILTLR